MSLEIFTNPVDLAYLLGIGLAAVALAITLKRFNQKIADKRQKS